MQWLRAGDFTPIGDPFYGSGAALANPPAEAVYNIANVNNRTLESPTLYMTIK